MSARPGRSASTGVLCLFVAFAALSAWGCGEGAPGADSGGVLAGGDGEPGRAVHPARGLSSALPLESPLASAPLVAREITSSADLIGGLRADGRLGDYTLANDRIRVIIQDIDHGAQFYIFGGNIIDADVVRPSGEAGKDLLAEFFTDVDLTHTLYPERIEVVSDGSSGDEARIRVTGTDFPWPVLPPKEPVEMLPVTVQQDYVLRPGQTWVTIETTLTHTGGRTINVLKAELLLVGSSLRMASEGLPVGELVGRTRYLSMMGSETIGASYLFAPESGAMTIPFEDAAQTGALLGGLRLRAGQSHTWRRIFLVGDRDAASVTDVFYALRGEPTGTLSGTVSASSGPVPDAKIVVIDASGNYVTECLSNASGQFTASLPGGEVTLQVSAVGRAGVTTAALAITPGRTTQAAVSLSPAGRLRFVSRDSAGAPAPVRVTLVRADGHRVQAFSATGDRILELEPGTYTASFSRGTEYSIGEFSVSVPADGSLVTVPSSGAVVLNRVIDTAGWLSGDFHLHQKNSNDSWTLLEDRVASLLAEGVEVGVPTDHDHATDLGPTVATLGLTGQLITAPGDEVSIVDYGHFNYFPVQLDLPDPNLLQGAKYYFGEDLQPLSASELFHKMRQNPGEEIIQINHPRDGAMGYFSMIAYNPETGQSPREPLAVDFNALEIKGDVFGEDSVLPDYFSLLNQGLRIAAMGNSDAHRGRAENGYPRTYLRVPDDRTSVATFDQVVAAIQGGHTTVSSGIYATLLAQAGAQSVGPGDTLAPGSSAVSLKVRLQCPDWMSMQHITVFANGIPLGFTGSGNTWTEALEASTTVALAPVRGQGRFEQTLTFGVRPVVDTYYIVLAWGDGNLGIVSGGQALAYTSPVYVDLATSGFVPPGPGTPVGPVPPTPPGRVAPPRCGDGSRHER